MVTAQIYNEDYKLNPKAPAWLVKDTFDLICEICGFKSGGWITLAADTVRQMRDHKCLPS